jgi:hypothetical protein
MSTLVTRFRQNARIAVPAAVLAIAALGWLAFGFFGVHTLFIDDKVNEAAPIFASGATADGAEVVTDELVAAIDAVIEDEGIASEVTASESAPMADAPEIINLAAGSFVGHAHPTSGDVTVLTDGSPQRFLRFENFETDNGPDLNIYLSNSSADAENGTFDDDFIDLGDLKGNIGPQNYEIPEDVDLSIYDTVVIWCVRFGISFGAADLT